MRTLPSHTPVVHQHQLPRRLPPRCIQRRGIIPPPHTVIRTQGAVRNAMRVLFQDVGDDIVAVDVAAVTSKPGEAQKTQLYRLHSVDHMSIYDDLH